MVRWMKRSDLVETAEIHQTVFPKQRNSIAWLKCLLESSPRCMTFISERDCEIVGYINWVQKSGFRAKSILELEQLAIAPEFQNNGLGSELIKKSLEIVKLQLASQGSVLTRVVINVPNGRFSRELYKTALEGEVDLTFSNAYVSERAQASYTSLSTV